MADPPADPATTGSNGRMHDGKFAPGNRLGKGSPVARRMHELRKELLDAYPEGRLRAVVLKLFDLAEGGDTQAARLLIEYAVGKAPQPIEVSGLGGESLDFARIQAAVLEPLADHPDLRFRVALNLLNLGQALDERGDEAGTPA